MKWSEGLSRGFAHGYYFPDFLFPVFPDWRFFSARVSSSHNNHSMCNAAMMFSAMETRGEEREKVLYILLDILTTDVA